MEMEVQQRLAERIKKSNVPAHILTRKLRMTYDLSRSSTYADSKWIPFWYDLGKEFKPKSILSMGDKLCVYTACLIIGAGGCEDVTYAEFGSSNRFTRQNLIISGAKKVKSNIEAYVEQDAFDFGIASGDFSGGFDFIWGALKLGGVLCVIDAGTQFEEFSKVKNRSSITFKLRHNIGLLRK